MRGVTKLALVAYPLFEVGRGAGQAAGRNTDELTTRGETRGSAKFTGARIRGLAIEGAYLELHGLTAKETCVLQRERTHKRGFACEYRGRSAWRP